MTIPRVKMSPEASRLLSLVKDDRESKRVYVFLDDTGCCGFSNVFVSSSDTKLSSGTWVRISEVDGISVYGEESYLKTTGEVTLILDVGPHESDNDSLSLETNYGKRLFVGLAT